MEHSYWNQTGKYQTQYNELYDMLVPGSGKCDTLAGELLRSASRLCYDFYNNGMGNNTSGAVNFLKQYDAIGAGTYDTIYEFTRGRMYQGRFNNDDLHVAIEKMVDQTMEMIINNPQLAQIENSEDMFDYEEEFQHFCEECGDEMERGCGYVCHYCEDERNAFEDEEDDY